MKSMMSLTPSSAILMFTRLKTSMTSTWLHLAFQKKMVWFLLKHLATMKCLGAVEPCNSVLQNSGKPRIKAKFLNEQIFTFEILNLQNSGKPHNRRNSGWPNFPLLRGSTVFSFFESGTQINGQKLPNVSQYQSLHFPSLFFKVI